MSKYRVEQLDRGGPPPQSYRFGIWRGASKVAEFGHDFRNDDRWLVINGATMPVNIDLLAVGGSQPLVVSRAGTELLDSLLEV